MAFVGSGSASLGQLSCFLLGAATTAAVTLLYQQLTHCRKDKKKNNHKDDTDDNIPSSFDAHPKIWDAPDLDLRLLRKAEAVIRWRTTAVTVVVERCTNDHNYSAILRTVEALGVQNVAIVDPPSTTQTSSSSTNSSNHPRDNGNEKKETVDRVNDSNINNNHDANANETTTWMDSKNKTLSQTTADERQQRSQHFLFAQNATEWLTIQEYQTTADCIAALRASGHRLWVTDLSQDAVPLTRGALQDAGQWPVLSRSSLSHKHNHNPSDNHDSSHPSSKLALVFGTEAVGCTQEMLQAADVRVYLPLRGFADSLNLSVAAALVLHHVLAVLEPNLIGSASESERRDLRRLWFPKLAQQRLLTSAEKRERKRLQLDLQKCRKIQERVDRAATQQQQAKKESNTTKIVISPEELDKLAKQPVYQAQLDAIEAKLNPEAVAHAMEHYVQHPPEPLSDLRRADEHRVTYVGKSTKASHAEHWKDMPAVSNAQSVPGVSRNFFQRQVEQQQQQGVGKTSAS